MSAAADDDEAEQEAANAGVQSRLDADAAAAAAAAAAKQELLSSSPHRLRHTQSMTCITGHTSHIAHHTSHVTCFFGLFFKGGRAAATLQSASRPSRRATECSAHKREGRHCARNTKK